MEFALVATFLLVPLFLGGTDLVQIISAQAQLNTSLQSLYLFAFANPTVANSTGNISAVVTLINSQATHKIVFPATMSNGNTNGTITYDCTTSAGVQTASTQAATCPNGQTKQAFVTYQVNTNVTMAVPVFHANPFPLSATGSVEIQ